MLIENTSGIRGSALGERGEAGSSSDPPELPLTHRGRTVRLGLDPTRDLRLVAAREEVQSILEASARLLAPDRALIASVFGEGRSVASLARLMGVSGKALRGRVRRLVDRMNSPLYRFVIEQSAPWAPDRRAVAIACIVEGRSIREAARLHGLSFHAARVHLLHVRALWRASVEHAERASHTHAIGDAA